MAKKFAKPSWIKRPPRESNVMGLFLRVLILGAALASGIPLNPPTPLEIPAGPGMPADLKISHREAGGAVFSPQGQVIPQMGSAFVAVKIPLLEFALQARNLARVIRLTPFETKEYYEKTFGSVNPFNMLETQAEHWAARVESDLAAFGLDKIWPTYQKCFSIEPVKGTLPTPTQCANFDPPTVQPSALYQMTPEKGKLVRMTEDIIEERAKSLAGPRQRTARSIHKGTATLDDAHDHHVQKRAIWAAGGILASLFVGALNRMTIESMKAELHTAAEERKTLATAVKALVGHTEQLKNSVDAVMKDLAFHKQGTNNLHALEVAMMWLSTTGLEIEHALSQARQAKFDPGLITPEQLTTAIKGLETTAKAQQRELLNANFANLANSPASYVVMDTGRLMVVGSFPVVLKTAPFHLFKYTGLPTPTAHGYVTYQITPAYLAFHPDTDTFFTMTTEEKKQNCRPVKGALLCDVEAHFKQRSMNPVGADEDRCLMAIKDSDATKMEAACAMKEARAHDTVVQVGHNKFAFFTVKESPEESPKLIQVTCNNAIQDVQPQEVTMITLPTGCTARSSSALVYGKGDIRSVALQASYVMPPAHFLNQISNMSKIAFEAIENAQGITWQDTQEQIEALEKLDTIGQPPSLRWWSFENAAGTIVIIVIAVAASVMIVILFISIAVCWTRRNKLKAARATAEAINREPLARAAVDALLSHQEAARALKQSAIKLATRHRTREVNPEEQPLSEFNLQRQIHSGPSSSGGSNRQSTLSQSLANGNISQGAYRHEQQPDPSAPARATAVVPPRPDPAPRDPNNIVPPGAYQNIWDPKNNQQQRPYVPQP